MWTAGGLRRAALGYNWLMLINSYIMVWSSERLQSGPGKDSFPFQAVEVNTVQCESRRCIAVEIADSGATTTKWLEWNPESKEHL